MLNAYGVERGRGFSSYNTSSPTAKKYTLLDGLRNMKGKFNAKKLTYGILGGCLLLLVLAVILQRYPKLRAFFQQDALYIAVVGPMSGEYLKSGDAMLKGVRLYLEVLNKQGGIDGKKIKLVESDDQNDPALAKQLAREIANQNQVLLVLGHYSSAASMAAGEVYQKFGIPAITASATVDDVTVDNHWYFRFIFSNRFQAQLLATYMSKILKHQSVSLIADQEEYGTSLARHFKVACDDLNVEIRHRWEFDSRQAGVEKQLDDIVNALKAEEDPGVIFIAAHAREGADIVTSLRYQKPQYTIIGADTFNTSEFIAQLNRDTIERIVPGYYSDGIYTVSPLNFRITGRRAQQFKELFRSNVGEAPSWVSASYYDAITLAVEAIKRADVQGTPHTLTDDRRKLRASLAELFQPDNPFQGVMGLSTFDHSGNLLRFAPVSRYEQQQLVPAWEQLQRIPDIAQIETGDLNQALLKDRIFNIGEHYSSKTDIVYTGVKINSIGALDLNAGVYTMDFYLWFRYREEFSTEQIEFLNATTPIRFVVAHQEEETSTSRKMQESVLVEDYTHAGITSRLYHLKGKFKMDFLPGLRQFGTHVLGMNFRHKTLARKNLIYVTDSEGMKPTGGESFTKYLKKTRVLGHDSDWTIADSLFFQDSAGKEALEDIHYFSLHQQREAYSRFNAVIRIKASVLTLQGILVTLRGVIPTDVVRFLAIFNGGLFLFFLYIGKIGRVKRFFRLLWLLQTIFGSVAFLSIQIITINLLEEWLDRQYMDLIMVIFDVFWWIIPAILLNLAFENFVWRPIEIRTGRLIPHIVRLMTGFMVYLLACFGIIAFVFDQRLTGLLATSGVVAMIIGLAVQMNISNIFSGIALNIERPFRIGDWVKIGDNEGEVLNMTWRTTRILTREQNILSIPNSTASESLVTNYTYPDDRYSLKFTLETVPIDAPEAVRKILRDATLAIKDVLPEPLPFIEFKGQGDSSAIFTIWFQVKDYEKKHEHLSAVWNSVWTHLIHAGIELATPCRFIYEFEGQESSWEQSTDPIFILQRMKLFQALSDDAQTQISRCMRPRHVRQGEIIVQQDDRGDSLFMIVEGVVGVWIQVAAQKSLEVDRMGAGEFFGEMSLLTGKPRTASIIATTDVLLYEVTKANIAPLIEKYPDTIQLLSDALAERTVHRESQKNSYQVEPIDREALTALFLRKIQDFFGQNPAKP